MDAGETDPRQSEAGPIDAARLLNGDAKLVRAKACRDVRMALRVDVRIHPKRHPGRQSFGTRDGRDPVDLTRRLRVDGADATGDCMGQFIARLPDPGQDDIRSLEARVQRHPHFAAGVRVGTTPHRPQQPHDRERGVRLQRVVNTMRVRRERIVDRAIGRLDRAGAIEVHGRANGVDDVGNANAVAVQAGGRRNER